MRSALAIRDLRRGDPDFSRACRRWTCQVASQIWPRHWSKAFPLPCKAAADAAHIAVAAYHRIDFLLTWNLAHIANAERRPRIEAVCRASRYSAPILCTPDELMGEES